VKVPESEGNLDSVKLGFLLFKSSLLRQVLEEFASLNKVHHEVDAIGSLENEVDSNDEGVVYLQLYQLFDHEVFNRLLLNHYVLTNTLHCVESLMAFALD